MQNHFQSWHKVTNIASIDISLIVVFITISGITLSGFYLLYVLEELEIVARKSAMKKVFRKIYIKTPVLESLFK